MKYILCFLSVYIAFLGVVFASSASSSSSSSNGETSMSSSSSGDASASASANGETINSSSEGTGTDADSAGANTDASASASTNLVSPSSSLQNNQNVISQPANTQVTAIKTTLPGSKNTVKKSTPLANNKPENKSESQSTSENTDSLETLTPADKVYKAIVEINDIQASNQAKINTKLQSQNRFLVAGVILLLLILVNQLVAFYIKYKNSRQVEQLKF